MTNQQNSQVSINHQLRILCNGFLRTINIEEIEHIPNDICNICVQYYNYSTSLTFSPIYHIKDGFILSDNNKCCTSGNHSQNHGFGSYILADIIPATNGIHCWRVHIYNPFSVEILLKVSPKVYKKLYIPNGYGVYLTKKEFVFGSLYSPTVSRNNIQQPQQQQQQQQSQ
eukprot:387437_1